MFNQLTKIVTGYKQSVTPIYTIHQRALDKINREYAGERKSAERDAENLRYQRELNKLRSPYLIKIHALSENMSEYVRSFHSSINTQTLQEVRELGQLDVVLSERELQSFIDRYTASGDYWALRAIVNLANQQGYKEVFDFNLENQIQTISDAETDAVFVIENYEADFAAESPVQNAAIQRISSNPEAHFAGYAEKFSVNPICSVEGFEDSVRNQIEEKFFSSDEYIEKKSFVEEIVTDGRIDFVRDNKKINRYAETIE